MTSETKAKALRTVLTVTGGVLCLCGVFMLLPVSWLKAMAGWFIAAEELDPVWPTAALFGYLLRTCLAAYLWIGVVLLVAASDPEKYRRLVDVAACMLMLLAVVCVAGGIASGIPPTYYLGDAVLSGIVGVLLLALRPGKEKAGEADAK
jgi:peptidoglycan/LPS O-acetylase OafA/YrhL